MLLLDEPVSGRSLGNPYLPAADPQLRIVVSPSCCRARHADGDERLRPHRGAETTAGSSPKARPKSSEYPAVIEAYLGQGASRLEIRDMVCGYGGVTASARHFAGGQGRQLVALIAPMAPARAHAAAISGSSPRVRVMLFGQGDCRRQAAARGRSGSRMSGRRRVFAHDGRGELDMGAYLPTVAAEIRDPRPDLCQFPRLLTEKAIAGTYRAVSSNAGDRRALMSRPRLIMFDEPSLGLAHIVGEPLQLFRASATQALPFCWLAERVCGARDVRPCLLLEGGRIVLPDPAPRDRERDVRKAYLGG